MRLYLCAVVGASIGCCAGGTSAPEPAPAPAAAPSPLTEALRQMGADAPAPPSAPGSPPTAPSAPASAVPTPPSAPGTAPAVATAPSTPASPASPAPAPAGPECAAAVAARDQVRAQLADLRMNLGGDSSRDLEATSAAMQACNADATCVRDGKARLARVEAYQRAKARHESETARLAQAEVGLYDADQRVTAACGASAPP